MATIAKTLIESMQASSSQTTQYTAAGIRTIIDKFTGMNTTAAVATLTINLVPSGGIASSANKIVEKTLAAGEAYTFPEIVGHVLNPGDSISTSDSVDNAITIRCSGREVN